MLELLKEKILSWTPEKADDFYNGLLRYQSDSAKIWEMDETGYYLYTGHYASYNNYDGTSFTLQMGDWSENLDKTKALSDLADQLGSTKIEKPTHIELTDVFGVTFTYSETIRPYGTIGLNFSNLKNTDDFKTTYLKFMSDFLVSAEELVRLVDTYTGDTLAKSYPNPADDMVLALNLFFDPATSKYFWAGNIKFEYERTAILSAVSREFNDMETTLRKTYGKDISVRTEIADIMREKCTIFQLP
jgi:hypothetical protein